jgi:DNA-binding transcriptional LysR family regulator
MNDQIPIDRSSEVGWDGYRVLLTVAEAGTLGRAAKRLGQSAPTVGRRIAAMEDALGARLFERTPEGLRPTRASLRVLPQIRQLASGASKVEALLRGQDESLERPVRIATTTALGAVDLTPRLAALRAREPELRFTLDYSLELVDLLRGEADIVLRHSRPGSPEFVGRKVARATTGLFASERYLSRNGNPRSRADLRRHRVIEAEGALERLPGSGWLRASRAETPSTVRCSELLGVAALARCDEGIALLPRYVAEQSPSLRRVLARQASWQTDLWLLTRGELRSVRRIRLVVDWLAQSYKGARL